MQICSNMIYRTYEVSVCRIVRCLCCIAALLRLLDFFGVFQQLRMLFGRFLTFLMGDSRARKRMPSGQVHPNACFGSLSPCLYFSLYNMYTSLYIFSVHVSVYHVHLVHLVHRSRSRSRALSLSLAPLLCICSCISAPSDRFFYGSHD